MKMVLLIALALTVLGGCVVVPAGPDYYGYRGYGHSYPYGYAYPGYPYRHGYYRHGYYWRQAS